MRRRPASTAFEICDEADFDATIAPGAEDEAPVALDAFRAGLDGADLPTACWEGASPLPPVAAADDEASPRRPLAFLFGRRGRVLASAGALALAAACVAALATGSRRAAPPHRAAIAETPHTGAPTGAGRPRRAEVAIRRPRRAARHSGARPRVASARSTPRRARLVRAVRPAPAAGRSRASRAPLARPAASGPSTFDVEFGLDG